jgi:hypothetical protein
MKINRFDVHYFSIPIGMAAGSVAGIRGLIA